MLLLAMVSTRFLYWRVYSILFGELYKHSGELWGGMLDSRGLTGPGSRRNPSRAFPDRGWNSLLPIRRWSKRCLSLVSDESVESNSPKQQLYATHTTLWSA